jgi:NADH-quinone oxidoreductase subunit N
VTDKLALLHPEIALFIATCVVMVLGLSRSAATRRFTALVAGLALIVAFVLSLFSPSSGGMFPSMLPFAKATIAGVSFLLLLSLVGVVDRDYESMISRGVRFDPLRANRGEFFAFFLFSVTGVMLCASADDLIWLFLALELTSLPTYIMVAMSSQKLRSQEAGVKYFFLGAFGAAIFLYGFAMLYGATGTTSLSEIRASFQASTLAGEGIPTLGVFGLTMAIIGIGFKIAAVPMHFYTADVYQGAASPVTGYLAFAPKTAGFLALLPLLATVGWGWPDSPNTVSSAGLPDAIRVVLWVMAAMTMTVGNVLALMQTSAKRVLAYSSVAHSGYILVGLVAGPGDGSSVWENGLAAVLFYLLVYGVTNAGAFAVLASLERRVSKETGDTEVDSINDLKGMWAQHPWLALAWSLCILSLLGFPPLLGFWPKLHLFFASISAGEVVLAVILAFNSAIAAFYYLRLVVAAYIDRADSTTTAKELTEFLSRPVAAFVAAGLVVALIFAFGGLQKASERAIEGDREVVVEQVDVTADGASISAAR